MADDLRDTYSIGNIINMAKPQPQSLSIPPEYTQDNPDLVAAASNKELMDMSPAYASASAPPPRPVEIRTGPPTAPLTPQAPANESDFLTDIIKKGESSGNYQAINREQPGNTASGAYQYTDHTWNGYGGYSKAALAPPAVQDQRFREDITDRLQKFNGDAFKAIAAHYLPALASDPTKWNDPVKVKGRTVKPVALYVRHIVKGTPLEKDFEQYLANQ